MEQYFGNGWIEVICGSMFAGKSEELIRRVKRMEYAHQKYICFKPSIDNRYSNDEIVSHSNRKTKSINIQYAKEVYKYLDNTYTAVVIDEIQFLDEDIIEVCSDLADKGYRVIVGGLDSDFKGEPFEITAKLMAKAEFVSKLTAICVKCGAPGTRTQRIVNGKPASYYDPIIIVGASQLYEPICRHCHEVQKTKN